MKQEFEFELSDKLKEKFPDEAHKYKAELLSSGRTYRISWEDEKGEYDYCYYDSKKVEEYIEEGKWVVIN